MFNLFTLTYYSVLDIHDVFSKNKNKVLKTFIHITIIKIWEEYVLNCHENIVINAKTNKQKNIGREVFYFLEAKYVFLFFPFGFEMKCDQDMFLWESPVKKINKSKLL